MIPHAAQQMVLDSTDRYRVVSTGRRWGKDALCKFCILQSTAQEILFMGPSFKMNKFFKGTMDILVGKDIHYTTSDRDDYRGRQFDLIIINEPATMTPYLLDEMLPCLIPNGKLLAVGTPVPHKKNETDLFIKLKKFAQSQRHFSDASFWTFSIKTNPFLNGEDMLNVLESVSEPEFRSSMLGEFVELPSDAAPITESPTRNTRRIK